MIQCECGVVLEAAGAGTVKKHFCKQVKRYPPYDYIESQLTEAKKGCFGFMIRQEETLTEGMNRNYAEFDNCRSELYSEIKRLKATISAARKVAESKVFRTPVKMRLRELLSGENQ